MTSPKNIHDSPVEPPAVDPPTAPPSEPPADEPSVDEPSVDEPQSDGMKARSRLADQTEAAHERALTEMQSDPRFANQYEKLRSYSPEGDPFFYPLWKKETGKAPQARAGDPPRTTDPMLVRPHPAQPLPAQPHPAQPLAAQPLAAQSLPTSPAADAKLEAPRGEEGSGLPRTITNTAKLPTLEPARLARDSAAELPKRNVRGWWVLVAVVGLALVGFALSSVGSHEDTPTSADSHTPDNAADEPPSEAKPAASSGPPQTEPSEPSPSSSPPEAPPSAPAEVLSPKKPLPKPPSSSKPPPKEAPPPVAPPPAPTDDVLVRKKES